MQRGFAFAAAAALLIAAPSVRLAQGAPNRGTASPIAKNFLNDAMQGDTSEVKFGQLAENNGGSSDTKDFGRMLVIDHTKAGEQVKATAQQVGVTVKNEPSSEPQTEYDKLAKLKSAAFDKEFAQAMVEDHQNDIAKFQKEADAKDGPASDLAQQQLPTLQKHLRMAQSLQRNQQASAP